MTETGAPQVQPSVTQGEEPGVPAMPAATLARERGRTWGAYFREHGIDYGRPHDAYPSNPYPAGSQDARDYDAGYKGAFNEAQ